MAQLPTTEAGQPTARDRKFEILIGALLIVVAVAAIVVAQGFRSSGLAADVGPARFPVIHATILTVLCAILVIRNIIGLSKGENAPAAAPISGVKVTLITVGIVATVIQYLAMGYVGYFASMFLYLCFLMAWMGMRHIVLNPLISAAITASLYLAFDYLLNVPLPVGTLFE